MISDKPRIVHNEERNFLGLVFCAGHWYKWNGAAWQQVDGRQAIAAAQILVAVQFAPGCPSILGEVKGPNVTY